MGLPIPDLADFVARCEDAGLDRVGMHDLPRTAEDWLDRLGLAREAAGVEHVFLLSAHTVEGAHDLLVREVDAVRRVIRPGP
jgi:hypothetical protein